MRSLASVALSHWLSLAWSMRPSRSLSRPSLQGATPTENAMVGVPASSVSVSELPLRMLVVNVPGFDMPQAVTNRATAASAAIGSGRPDFHLFLMASPFSGDDLPPHPTGSMSARRRGSHGSGSGGDQLVEALAGPGQAHG